MLDKYVLHTYKQKKDSMLCGPPIIIARNSSCNKVRFSQVCVIPSVHGGGSMQWGGEGGVSQHAIRQGVCIQAYNWAVGVSQHAIGQGWGCLKEWW